MRDGFDSGHEGEDDFAAWGSRTAASLLVIKRGLSLARRLMVASQIDEAFAILEAIERQLDDLPPPVVLRRRAATDLPWLPVAAFQDDSLATLAIVILQVLAEGGAGLGLLPTKICSCTEALESTDRQSPVLSAGNSATQPMSSGSDVVTVRERKVLSMIGQGYSNKRIARSLEISPETVKSHVKHIFSKLAVSTRSEAVSRAGSLGLL